MPDTESTNQPADVIHFCSLKDLGALLVRDAGLREGKFDVTFQLNFAFGRIGPSPEQALPGAMLGIQGAGLLRVTEDGPFTVDASLINPE